MLKEICLTVMMASAPMASGADTVQPLNVKVGLWEMVWTRTTTGQLPIPQELLARLTPEQRARMQERMNAQSSSQGTKTITRKQCLTTEKLRHTGAFGDDQESCTRTITASTATRTEIKMQCSERGIKSDGRLVVEALNSESVKGSMNLVASGSDHSMKMTSDFTGKWIGSACGDMK